MRRQVPKGFLLLATQKHEALRRGIRLDGTTSTVKLPLYKLPPEAPRKPGQGRESSSRVWRFDRSMKERWTTSVGDLSPAEQVSPPWSQGILFTLTHRLLVMDDNRRNQQVAYFHDEVAIKRAMESPVSRVAIGQSRNGEWLIVNY